MNKGVSGNKTIFIASGRVYETNAVPPTARVSLKEGEALIKSGQATPVASTYQDQFPWLKPQK